MERREPDAALGVAQKGKNQKLKFLSSFVQNPVLMRSGQEVNRNGVCPRGGGRSGRIYQSERLKKCPASMGRACSETKSKGEYFRYVFGYVIKYITVSHCFY